MSVSSISSQFSASSAAISPGESQSIDELDSRQKKEVAELKTRDAQVKQHEQAHLAAAGPYAKGGVHYKYTTGPDGNRYAVGGKVGIDSSKVSNDPEATIGKAQVVRRAALAPANPSTQDRRVASEASQMELEARQELTKNKVDENQGYNKDGHRTATAPKPVFIDSVT